MTQTITEAEIAEGERLLAAATKGPWVMEYSEIGAGPDRHLVAFVMGADEAYVLVDESPDAIDGPPSSNGELAVWMRNNLPALLATARREAALREANERLKGAILKALQSTAGREYLLADLASNAGFTADDLLPPTASQFAHEAECKSAALAALAERRRKEART